MKQIYKTILYSVLTLLIVSCAEDPMEKEQYKKEVYLVGAYDRVWKIDVNYSEQPVSDFFTVTTSGTLNLDQDVHVSMRINEDIVATYNRKFLGELNEDKFFVPLDETLYSIPSLDNITLDHQKGISVDVPIQIITQNLSADTRYVIPVQIESSTPYDVNESGRKMLIHLNLKNEYSGNYQLDGHMTEPGLNPRRIQKAKVLTATGVNTVRLFHAMNNESSKKEDIAAKTIEITISDEWVTGSETLKKVSVRGWGGLAITDHGKGFYNTEKKEFRIAYTVNDTQIKYEENLTISAK